MNQENPEDEILIEKRGAAVFITLNRPKVLNALSLEMIRTLASCLRRWEADPDIRAVFIKGSGGRAFCAGGDVRAFYNAGMNYRRGLIDARVPAVYFAEEYSLDKQIFHYPKPIVAFMNGITMGGGFGIAGHCRHRIATAHTKFAMPESKIGFFPDVGACYHLLRSPGHLGWYLALSGETIGAADMIAAGLADSYIAPENEEALTQRLVDGAAPETVIATLSETPPEKPALAAYADRIAEIFNAQDVMQIVANLEQDGSEWAQETLAILRARAPSTLMVTAEHMRRMESADFDRLIAADFVLAQHFLRHFDMYEGIRAMIIEKDNAPRWDPPRLEAVTPDIVKEYFKPTGYDLNEVQIFAA